MKKDEGILKTPPGAKPQVEAARTTDAQTALELASELVQSKKEETAVDRAVPFKSIALELASLLVKANKETGIDRLSQFIFFSVAASSRVRSDWASLSLCLSLSL